MSAPRKVAVITGASSGIGRAAALSLYKTGWSVVLVARRKDALKETQQILRDAVPEASQDDKRVVFCIADLSLEESSKVVFDFVRETYGRVDLLFNNAGINVPAVPLEELSMSDYRALMAVNVDACFYCAQQAIKLMKTQSPKGGRIINNGSISAYVPRVFSAPYTMSKHAILGLTKCIALDGRPDNIVCSQLDIGGAGTPIQAASGSEKLQPNGERVQEPLFEVDHAGEAVAYMANLPLSVNILSQTIMASNMPYVGRG